MHPCVIFLYLCSGDEYYEYKYRIFYMNILTQINNVAAPISFAASHVNVEIMSMSHNHKCSNNNLSLAKVKRKGGTINKY